MNILEANKIHCIGIGGAGVSALAGLLVGLGKEVTGTEDNESPRTLDPLKKKGVSVISEKDKLPEVDAFVYSDAWLTNHPEVLEEAKKRGVPVYSYFEALGEVSKKYKTIAIAGTHGKTTTTAMLARMLKSIDPTVIVGSIMRDTDTNVLIGESEYLLVEACEYNDHFLHLSPTILAITNIELDHTDYFKDIDQLVGSYKKLVEKLPEDGALILNKAGKYEQALSEHAKCKVIDYAEVEAPTLLIPGEFNIENAKTAMATAIAVEGENESHKEGLESFPGTWRRFEFKGKTNEGSLVYDDYAHHPTAIEKTVAAVKKHFPSKEIVVAFHPHLYSRTRDFMDGFAESLALADKVYVAPIFAAREEFDGVTTNKALVEKINEAGGCAETIDGKEGLQSVVEECGKDTVLFTMGAGDIYTWIPEYVSVNFS
tara:strand:+ start:2441 stop:3724 length:1284 start_codon:yes stop_codon:yes gene_type:complete